jgi:hypothetical protein
MSKAKHLREATRAVWRRSYECARAQSWWTQATPAVAALMAALRQLPSEDALHDRYWAPGDIPGETLRRHITTEVQPEHLLELEDACFWLRLRELCGGG